MFSDKSSAWMTVDTALYVMSAGETKEDTNLVCFTESKDKEVSLAVLTGQYYYISPIGTWLI